MLKAIQEELANLQNEDSNKPNAEAKKKGFDALTAFRKATPNNSNYNSNHNNSSMKLKETIRQLIANGRLQQAFELLPSTDNELVLLKGRFNRLQSEERQGIISTDNANLERNRIVSSLLWYVDAYQEQEINKSITPEVPNINTPKPPEDKAKPLKVFVSYSKTDVKDREKLETHLASLKRDGSIEIWSDQELIPGEEWDKGIQDKLKTADIILLLVSANFIATDYIWDKEMTRAMERHESRDVYVVPIILSPCDWQSTPFAKLNALPTKGTPISKHPNQDEAWTEIATKLRELVKGIKLKS